MRDALLDLIGRSPDRLSDARFNALALRLFARQYARNRPYRRFCRSAGVCPERLSDWRGIPPLPVTAFKWADIACLPVAEAARCFHSSGTTRTTRSRHYLFDTAVAAAAVAAHFKRHLLPDRLRIRMMCLTPSPEEAPHASLSFMMETVRRRFGTPESRYYVQNGCLLSDRLIAEMAQATAPVALLGTSLAFDRFMTDCRERDVTLTLPPKSRLMDTGGRKGVEREISPGRIYAFAERYWGIDPAYCVNEYGMTEMTSQFYDHVAGDPPGPRIHLPPPQVRTRILSPETLTPVPEGETGLLAHYDLANIDSAAAILTEDIGRRTGGGFILLGRAPGAPEKGCSLTADALLQEMRPALPAAGKEG